MKFIFYSISVVLLSSSCKERKVQSISSSCYPIIKDLKRGEMVVDFPAKVRLSGGLISGGFLELDGANAWGACNLPNSFLQDSLDVYVSGYFLTSPSLDLLNITPVPFEVTAIKRR